MEDHCPTCGKSPTCECPREGWVWSTNDEHFHSDEFADIEGAKNAAIEDGILADGDSFWVGRVDRFDLVDEFDPATRIIENFEEYIYDNAGGDGDAFDCSPTQIAELNDLIRQWMTKNEIAPTRYRVVNVQHFTFTQCGELARDLRPGEALGDDVADKLQCQRQAGHDGTCEFQP